VTVDHILETAGRILAALARQAWPAALDVDGVEVDDLVADNRMLVVVHNLMVVVHSCVAEAHSHVVVAHSLVDHAQVAARSPMVGAHALEEARSRRVAEEDRSRKAEAHSHRGQEVAHTPKGQAEARSHEGLVDARNREGQEEAHEVEDILGDAMVVLLVAGLTHGADDHPRDSAVD